MFEWAATMLSQGTPTGAIDVIAIRDSSGNLSCSPFHVKLNKLAKKGDSCRTVKLAVNTRDVALSMKLGSAGEAFFVERTDQKIFNNNSTNSISHVTEFNQDNVGSAFQGMPLSRNNSISALTVTGTSNSMAQSESRRRYRSFSDGDIDGDYKYLLDEQLIMAQSLCVPVSFHHCVGIEPPIPSLSGRTGDTNTKLGHGNNSTAPDHFRMHPSNTSTASLPELCASVSLDSASVTGAVSHPADASILKFQHLSAVKQSCLGDDNLSYSSVSMAGSSSNNDIEQSRCAGISNSYQGKVTESESVSIAEAGSKYLTSVEGSKNPPPSISAVVSISELQSNESGMKLSGSGGNAIPDKEVAADGSGTPQLPVSIGESVPQRDSARSTALRNTGTPPSWSWTWGALPVKSKSKSSTDLILMLENGNAISPNTAGSPNSMKVSTAQSSNSSTANVTPNDSVGDRMYGMSSQPAATEIADSALSHAIQSRPYDLAPGSSSSSSSSIDRVDRLDLVLAMTKIPIEDEETCRKDFIDIDRSEGHTHFNDCIGIGTEISHCPVMTPTPLLSGYDGNIEDSGDQDHQSQVKTAKIDAGHVDGEFMASSSQHNSRPRGSGPQWRDSFADLGSSTFSLYRSKDFHQNQSHKRISEAGASQPDLLGAYVKGDPSHGDMWQWDVASPLINHDIDDIAITVADELEDRNTPSMQMIQSESETKSLREMCSSQIVEKSIVQDVTKGDGCSMGEGDCDGDTDQEVDTLSLHDIPLDQISPEPAGGDFYDSDTESYLSLSLDDGESVKENPLRLKPRKYRYRRVLVPSQEQLQSLDLCDGENEVSFELIGQESKGAYSTPLLRNQLFVWPHDAKIVIIDIEGAITAVSKGGSGWGMGGFLSAPRTAVHNGVAKLLTNIHGNGYHILYIAQSTSTALGTKEHLAKVAAGSDIKLPPGPVFQSPDSLIRAYGAARTDLFKAAALRGLKSLFPVGHNPYYACFGTRPCDMVAFSRCGVPGGRTFIVSPDTGEIRGINRTFRSSYEQVNQVLHEMFPAVSDSQTLFSPRPRQHSVPGQGPGTGTGSGTGCMSPSTSTLHDSFYTVSDPATASHPVSAFISPGNMRSNLPLPLPLASSSSLPLNVVLPLSLSSKSGRDATCSLAEEDFSDFNFWKIPHVSLA